MYPSIRPLNNRPANNLRGANRLPEAVVAIEAQAEVAAVIVPEAVAAVIAARVVRVVAEASAAVEAMAALVEAQGADRADVVIGLCRGVASAAFAWTRSST